MSQLQKVAILGARGTLGQYILPALLSSGFDVTIVARPGTASSFPASRNHVPVVEAAGTLASYSAAFSGHDAIVSVVGPRAHLDQTLMMDAAAAVGVRRFVVSQFANSARQEEGAFAEFEDARESKRRVIRHAEGLAERAAAAAADGGFTWSAVATGHFLDWAIKKFPQVGFDIPNRSATLYDSGNQPITGTCMHDIARAVVGILRKPAETANKHLRIRSLEVTQRQILTAFEAATGEKWTVREEKSADVVARGRQRMADGDRMGFLDVLVIQLWEEGTGRGIVVSREESDNELLGIREESVEDMVARILDPEQLPL